MNEDIKKIVAEYAKYGDVSKLEYRGKMRIYGYSDKELVETQPHDWSWHTAWSFVLKRDNKKYKMIILDLFLKKHYAVISGKSWCVTESVCAEHVILPTFIGCSVNTATKLNHFTPHPTCRVVREIKGDE